MSNPSPEVILSRNELLYILNQLGSKNVVGVELKEFGLAKEDLDALLDEGKKSLIGRSLLVTGSDPKIQTISPEVFQLVKVAAKRDLAIILVRGIKGYRQQAYIFNFLDDRIVEHTRPDEKTHRFMPVADFDSLLKRVNQLVPLKPVILDGRQQFKIAETSFAEARRLLTNGSSEEAKRLFLKNGFSEEVIPPLVQALARPEFSLSLACLVVKGNEAVAANSAAIFADEESAWGIWPYNMEAVPPILLVFSSGITDVYSALSDWLAVRKKK